MPDIDSRNLQEFANPGENKPAGGHALVRPTSGISERVIGAQPVAVHRDDQKVFQKLATLAAAAGADWFYRFPVKKKEGGVDYIEGPSIKLANDVARIFGNCAIEVRELDVGDAFVFYARFTDIETGFSMERAYRQRKGQGSIRTRDPDRAQDLAYQIGQSKSIRNVICNSLQIYCDYAFEQAQNSLVEKIGKSLDAWRERTLEGLRKMPVDVARVERTIGRTSKDWLAPDVARIVAMMRSVADGMASIDEVFPPVAEVTPPGSASAGSTGAGAEAGVQGANQADHGDQADAGVRDPGASTDGEDAIDLAYRLGQEAKAKGLTRRQIPGEYRLPTRTAEALAWTAGVEGQPKP